MFAKTQFVIPAISFETVLVSQRVSGMVRVSWDGIVRRKVYGLEILADGSTDHQIVERLILDLDYPQELVRPRSTPPAMIIKRCRINGHIITHCLHVEGAKWGFFRTLHLQFARYNPANTSQTHQPTVLRSLQMSTARHLHLFTIMPSSNPEFITS